jgi:hypothetical protein
MGAGRPPILWPLHTRPLCLQNRTFSGRSKVREGRQPTASAPDSALGAASRWRQGSATAGVAVRTHADLALARASRFPAPPERGAIQLDQRDGSGGANRAGVPGQPAAPDAARAGHRRGYLGRKTAAATRAASADVAVPAGPQRQRAVLQGACSSPPRPLCGTSGGTCPPGAQSTVEPERRTSSATWAARRRRRRRSPAGCSRPARSRAAPSARAGPGRRSAATSRAMRATAGAGVPAATGTGEGASCRSGAGPPTLPGA